LEHRYSLSLSRRLREVRCIKAQSHQFFVRWKRKYLSELHKRNKWRFPSKNVEERDLVVVKETTFPQKNGDWPESSDSTWETVARPKWSI